MEKPKKILGMSFKFLGDVAITVPALRAIKEHFPQCELHMLVAEEAAPLLEHLPYLKRVWRFPRSRGNALIGQSWPIIRALRRERFDRSVDFVGNDRGALLSLLCGAPRRLGPIVDRGFWGRQYCYNERIPEAHMAQHESRRTLHILSRWGIPYPSSLKLELHADPAQEEFAKEILPGECIIAHITTSQPKKEWPVALWAELHAQAAVAGYQIVFSAGPSNREQRLFQELKALAPKASFLPAMPNLAEFLAVVKRATLFISGDTGPLHFAAGLGIPTISLFGPSYSHQWAPLGPRNCVLKGRACQCPQTDAVCTNPMPCVAAIKPEQVIREVRAFLEKKKIAVR